MVKAGRCFTGVAARVGAWVVGSALLVVFACGCRAILGIGDPEIVDASADQSSSIDAAHADRAMSTDATSEAHDAPDSGVNDASDSGENDASDSGVNDASDAGGNDASDAGDASPSYVIAEIPVPTANSGPQGIVASPDGTIWFTEFTGDQIGRIDPVTNTITEIPLDANNDAGVGLLAPDGIANGPSGTLFFTELNGNALVKLSTAGVLGVRYILAQQDETPQGLTTGPDDAIWFGEASGSGRMTLADYDHVPPIQPNSYPFPSHPVGGGVGVASGWPWMGTAPSMRS